MTATPDPYDEALKAVQAGRMGEGLQRIRSAMIAATTGRDASNVSFSSPSSA